MHFPHMNKKELALQLFQTIIHLENDVTKMIAEVIVDVSTFSVDRPFDYIVPEQFESIVERGSRVHVPFGNRKVQGFITNVKEQYRFR